MLTRSSNPRHAAETARLQFETAASVVSPTVVRLSPRHEGPQRRQDPLGRFLGQEVPAVLELVQFEVLKLALPAFQFLPSKCDVFEAPEDQGRLRREGFASLPDRPQPSGRANDVTRKRRACRTSFGRE